MCVQNYERRECAVVLSNAPALERRERKDLHLMLRRCKCRSFATLKDDKLSYHYLRNSPLVSDPQKVRQASRTTKN